MHAPQRRNRPLGPGEQPSGAEFQMNEHEATFEARGSAAPRTRDPLAIIQELIDPALLLDDESMAKAHR